MGPGLSGRPIGKNPFCSTGLLLADGRPGEMGRGLSRSGSDHPTGRECRPAQKTCPVYVLRTCYVQYNTACTVGGTLLLTGRCLHLAGHTRRSAMQGVLQGTESQVTADAERAGQESPVESREDSRLAGMNFAWPKPDKLVARASYPALDTRGAQLSVSARLNHQEREGSHVSSRGIRESCTASLLMRR